MGKLLKRATDVGLTAAIVLLPLLSGCTVMASKEQLSMLEEARKKAESAEADLNACKQMRAQLERELADKKALLAKLSNDRDVVRKALSE
jgi:septal ring factor EnvC (AmiA/AmiB activator)